MKDEDEHTYGFSCSCGNNEVECTCINSVLEFLKLDVKELSTKGGKEWLDLHRLLRNHKFLERPLPASELAAFLHRVSRCKDGNVTF